MNKKSSIACPSSRMKKGAKLLAVRNTNGRMAILPQTLAIDDGFIKKASNHHEPAETRFRFTNKCIENGCKQWNGKGCGLSDFIIKYLDKVQPAEVLPACSIRVQCRWFIQQGADACKICPYVAMEI